VETPGVYSIGIMVTGGPRMVIFRISNSVLGPVFISAHVTIGALPVLLASPALWAGLRVTRTLRRWL
jgi:hypothetical protein